MHTMIALKICFFSSYIHLKKPFKKSLCCVCIFQDMGVSMCVHVSVCVCTCACVSVRVHVPQHAYGSQMTTLGVGPHLLPHFKQCLLLVFVAYSRLAGPQSFWRSGDRLVSTSHLSMEHLGYRHVHYCVWLHAGSGDSNSGDGKHLPTPENHFKVSLIVQKNDFFLFFFFTTSFYD